MAEFDASWYEFNPANALPSAVTDILNAVQGALSAIETALNAVVTVFNVLATLLIGLADALQAVLEAIRQDILALIESLEEAGVRYLGYVPLGPGESLSPSAWLERVARSLDDPGDPNAPNFGTTQDQALCIAMIALPNFNDLLAGMKALVEAMGKPFLYNDSLVGVRAKTDAEKALSAWPPYLVDLTELGKNYYARMEGLTNVNGTFIPGDVVTGKKSLTTAKVLAVGENELTVSIIGLNNTYEQPEFEDGEEITASQSGASATLGTPAVTPSTASRGAGTAPDWGVAVTLIEVFPFFQDLANVLKKVLGFLTFGQGLADLLKQYIAFMEQKLAIIQALVDEIQIVIDNFEALLSLTDINVLFISGAGTTAELRSAIFAAGLPDGLTAESVSAAIQNARLTNINNAGLSGTIEDFQADVDANVDDMYATTQAILDAAGLKLDVDKATFGTTLAGVPATASTEMLSAGGIAIHIGGAPVSEFNDTGDNPDISATVDFVAAVFGAAA